MCGGTKLSSASCHCWTAAVSPTSCHAGPPFKLRFTLNRQNWTGYSEKFGKAKPTLGRLPAHTLHFTPRGRYVPRGRLPYAIVANFKILWAAACSFMAGPYFKLGRNRTRGYRLQCYGGFAMGNVFSSNSLRRTRERFGGEQWYGLSVSRCRISCGLDFACRQGRAMLLSVSHTFEK